MPTETEMLTLLQTGLLVVFLAVTGLFLALTIANRRRLKHVLLAVPVGRLFGVPARPAAFALIILAILAAGLLAGASVSPLLMLGYLAGAVVWGVATHMSSSVYVFQTGIVRSLIDVESYIPWTIVDDYFFRERGRRVEFVFLHRDVGGRKGRYEVHVPRKYAVEFSEIVEDILETRFTLRLQRSRILRELKGL